MIFNNLEKCRKNAIFLEMSKKSTLCKVPLSGRPVLTTKCVRTGVLAGGGGGAAPLILYGGGQKSL